MLRFSSEVVFYAHQEPISADLMSCNGCLRDAQNTYMMELEASTFQHNKTAISRAK